MVVTPGVRMLLSLDGNIARRAAIDLLKQGMPLLHAVVTVIAVSAVLNTPDKEPNR